MRKPYLLDLFCGAGGASEGYARAGFEGYDHRLAHARCVWTPEAFRDQERAARRIPSGGRGLPDA